VVINIKSISPAIVNILVFDEITKLHGRDLLFNPFSKHRQLLVVDVTQFNNRIHPSP